MIVIPWNKGSLSDFDLHYETEEEQFSTESNDWAKKYPAVEGRCSSVISLSYNIFQYEAQG